jgi:ATP-binding cassette subfamily B multidrug efflux pump
MKLLARFLRTFGTRHTPAYAAGLAFLLATAALTVAVPALVSHAVDAMAAGAASEVAAWAWAIVGAGVAVTVVRTLSRVLIFNPGRVIEHDLRSALFGHLLRLPRSFFEAMSAGELVSRGTNDVASVRGFIGFGLLQVFNVVLLLAFTLAQMLATDLVLTAACVAPLLLATLILRRAVARMFVLMVQSQQALGALSSRTLEAYGGVPALQSFNAVPLARARFNEANDKLLGHALESASIQSWALPIVDVVGNLCLVLILYIGGTRIIDGELTPGALAAFAGYVRIVAGGLTALGWLVNALQRGWVSLKRLYEVLDTPAPLADEAPPDAARGPAPTLTLNHLSFRYPPRADGLPEAEPALSDLSLTIPAGTTLGVFGETGSGKTTLLSLLARVIEPPPGAILADGADIREAPPRHWWRRCAWVSQEPHLFSQSIRDNIALADPPEARPPGRVEAAAEQAALATDLAVLPQGLETLVGERGVTLSGGQRQRTALARAFYRDFNVLLLDDVLSAVDHATERRLIDAIYACRPDATRVFVSHRVSALASADRIIVLERGRVVAEGTHGALIARGEGPYWRAWRLQQAREGAGDEGGDPNATAATAPGAPGGAS